MAVAKRQPYTGRYPANQESRGTIRPSASAHAARRGEAFSSSRFVTTPHHHSSTPRSPHAFRIPPLIRRNIALFALSQSFTGIGMQFAYGLGPLMVLSLTGSASLAGMFVGSIGLSRFLVSYPIGKITDAYGRKPGIFLGLTLSLLGTAAVGLSVELNSFAGLLGGMLLFGMGMNGAQQLRVGATDMVPAHHRASALGYVALGSLLSMAASSPLVHLSETMAAGLGRDPLGLPWLLMPALIVPGMILISFVRPDPKIIGQNLERYYPGYVAPKREHAPSVFHPMSLIRHKRLRLATVSNCAAQGTMAVVMVLTSLVLHEHGHSLGMIVFSHTFHSAGMWAFQVPLGRLSDRYGHQRVMLPGVATALVGALLVALTGEWWTVTLGTFLVGIGWAAANVSATALVADYFPTHERGRAIGVSDSFAGAVAVAMAIVTGPILEWSGLVATGVIAAVIAAPPLVMAGTQLALRKRMVHAAD
jgi:MFS family permease